MTTSEPDRLADIKTRRAAMPAEPLEVHVTPTEEEYYRQWRIIEYGEPDAYGDRNRLAFLGEEDERVAAFIVHAPADIDQLIAEVDRLRVMLTDCRTHRDRAEKSETRLLELLEQIRVLVRRDPHED